VNFSMHENCIHCVATTASNAVMQYRKKIWISEHAFQRALQSKNPSMPMVLKMNFLFSKRFLKCVSLSVSCHSLAHSWCSNVFHHAHVAIRSQLWVYNAPSPITSSRLAIWPVKTFRQAAASPKIWGGPKCSILGE